MRPLEKCNMQNSENNGNSMRGLHNSATMLQMEPILTETYLTVVLDPNLLTGIKTDEWLVWTSEELNATKAVRNLSRSEKCLHAV